MHRYFQVEEIKREIFERSLSYLVAAAPKSDCVVEHKVKKDGT
jgi:hypothetical protein